MRTLLSPRRHDDAGAVAVIFAIMALTLLLIAGLVVDLGLARDTRRQSQNAADASALAAANVLYPTSETCTAGPVTPPCVTDAVNAAQAYALTNFGVDAADWSSCPAAPAGYAVSTGSPSCISFDDLASPTRVWVVMPTRTVNTTFGALADVSGIDVAARARATVGGSTMSDCGLCLLGPSHSLQNGDLELANTSLHANGNLSTGPQGSIDVTNGSVSVQGVASGNISPTATSGSLPIIDPMAGFDLPSAANNWHGAPTNPRPKTNPCTQGPGFYNGYNVSGNGTCTLAPGLYIFTGDLRMSGQRSINASAGVTLYFTCGTAVSTRACNSGESGGSMTTTGQGTLTIAPPSSGPLAGLSIASDRNNTSTLDFRGNGAGSVRGTIYAASGTLGFRGNGNGEAMDSLVVVRTVSFNGNPSAMSLVYNAENNVEFPPEPPALDQ